MQSFKDAKGRTWLLEITVAGVKRVHSLTGVDLYALPGDGLKPLAALIGDVVKLAAVLFVLARDADGSPPKSEDDFAAGLAGDELGGAADAFWEALIDSLPRAETRKLLAEFWSKTKAVHELLERNVMADLEEIDPEAAAAKILAGKG